MSERVKLTMEEASALLPDGDRIHTFLSLPGMLIGADWDRQDLLDHFAKHGVELAGEQATAMNHGLTFNDGEKWIFVATRKETCVQP